MELNRLRIIALAGLAAADVAAVLFVLSVFAGADAGLDLPARAAPGLVPSAPASLPSDAPRDDSETISRPLFAKSRRPSRNSAHAPSGASAQPPAGLKLLAVIVYGEKTRAFVASGVSPEGRWLGIGDAIENWIVDSISAQVIALRQDDDRIRVAIDYGGSGKVASVPATLPEQLKRTETGDTEPAKVVAPDSFAGAKEHRGNH